MDSDTSMCMNLCDDDEYMSPLPSSGEQAMVAQAMVAAVANADRPFISVKDALKLIYFVFDSGSTIHVFSTKSMMFNVRQVPPMILSTAIRGKTVVISERGEVKLNDQWTLKDVAYVPNAHANLISESRLTDAGFCIYKDKEFIRVSKTGADGIDKTLLLGYRVGKLWAYPIGGSTAATKLKLTQAPPTITLVPASAVRASSSSSSSSASSSSSSSSAAVAASPPRSIPRLARGGPVPVPVAGSASTGVRGS